VADQVAAPGARPRWRDAARYLVGLGIGILVLALLFGRRGELASAWRELGRTRPGWVLAALAAEGVSLILYALLQRRVLRLAAAGLPMPVLLALTLANDAIANTMPGEPAVSSAYRYRYYRRYGATGASAGWTIFTILIAQAIGMSLVMLIGVLVALAASASAQAAGAALVGLVIVVGAGTVLVRRDLVLTLASAAVRGARRVTGHPRGSVGAGIESTLTRMREIPLGPGATAGVVALATGVWLADFGCLLCSFGAVRAPVPWVGVLLGYGVAQVVGSLPVVPGGIGIVDGSLAVILTAYGAGRVPALSVTLAYRIVSFWLPVAVGWCTVAVLAAVTRRRRGMGL
jgi:uncharacterized protein (TIRG00374 family)